MVDKKSNQSIIDFVISAVKIVVFVAMLSLTVLAVDRIVESPDLQNESQLKKREVVSQKYLDMVQSLSAKRGNSSAIHPHEWNLAVKTAEKAIHKNRDYDDAINKFSKVKLSVNDEKYKKMADLEIVRLQNAKKNRDHIDQVISSLKIQAGPSVKKQDYQQAASVYKDYDGPYKDETAVIRSSFVKQYMEEAKNFATRQKNAVARAEKEKETLLAATVPYIIKGEYEKANKVFLAKEPTTNMAQMKKTLADLADVDSFILDSFTRDVGKKIKIPTESKKYNVTVKGVHDQRIIAEDSMGKIKVTIKIKLSDLTLEEKIRRLSYMDETARNIFLGMMYAREGNPGDAKIYLSKTGDFQPLIENELAAVMEKNRAELAKSQYHRLLRKAGIKGDLENDINIVAQLGKKKISSRSRAYIQKMSSYFQERHNEYASQHNDVMSAINDMLVRSRHPVKQQASEVKKEQTIAANNHKTIKIKPELFRIKTREDLFRSLRKTNPNYDLTGDFGTDGKDRFNRVDLTDAKIDNIAVLKNLDLEYLNISGTSVADINAVKKMPLKVLVLDNSKVTDLMPIRYMRTLRELYMTGIPITTLKELNMLKLEKLGFDPSKIKDTSEFRILRKMKSLETVFTPFGDFDMPRFWVKLEAGDFKKPPPDSDDSEQKKYVYDDSDPKKEKRRSKKKETYGRKVSIHKTRKEKYMSSKAASGTNKSNTARGLVIQKSAQKINDSKE